MNIFKDITLIYVAHKSDSIIEKNIHKRKKKLIDFLLRKGFEYDLIFKTVNKIITT